LRTLEKKLERLQRQEHPRILDQIRITKGDINRALEMEYVKWKQRTKRNRYRMGDQNTQYFHVGLLNDDDQFS
jgi:hypothetical protein